MTMATLDLPIQFFTPRLVLEKLRYEDAEEIFYTYASKPEATRHMSWPTHQSLDDTKSFLRYAIEGWDTGKDYSFSIRLRGNARLIGSFGIINDNGNVQFGYILTPTHWNQGYATEACGGMMKILKALHGVKSIKTFADVDNIASARVLEKSGLIEVARLSDWFRFVNQNNALKDCIHFQLPI